MENAKIIFEKGAITLAGAWIGNKWGVLFPTLVILTILMILDQVSGILASKKEALDYPDDKKYGLSSKKGIRGIYKKLGYILMILVASITDYLLFEFAKELGIIVSHETMFGLLITVWLIINELLSILENAGRMGAELPEFLKKILSDLKSDIENKTDL